MTKEALKDYLLEAVNAVGKEEVDVLFPPTKEPGLYAVMQELVGLKGAVSKISDANLKLNQEVSELVKTVAVQQQGDTTSPAEATQKIASLEATLKKVLGQLMDMDELMQLTVDSFSELPKLTTSTVDTYEKDIVSWKKGFDMTTTRWQKMLQANDLRKVGLVGEQFNPKLHQAVGVKHWNNIANNIILETEQAGFLHDGKVVRLAKVVVNKVKNVPKATTSRRRNKPMQVAQATNGNGHIVTTRIPELEEWGPPPTVEITEEFGTTKITDKKQQAKKEKNRKPNKKKKQQAAQQKKDVKKKQQQKEAAKKLKQQQKKQAKKGKTKKKKAKQLANTTKKRTTKKRTQKNKNKQKELVTSGKVTIQKMEKNSNYLIIVRQGVD